MGKAVYEAAWDGDEAELTRLIGLGGNVNWHNPDLVRRRMCLAWAPASSPPLLLSPPRSPETAPFSPELAVQRAAALAAPPPRRPAELGTRVLVAWRAPHPRVLAHAPRVLWHSMTPRVLHLPQSGFTALLIASWHGREGCVRLLLEAEAIEVNAKVSLEHALPQHMRWVRFHVVIPFGLSFVFRAASMIQHCIGRHATATSRSPSAFSKGAPIRRFETSSARRPSTTHGRRARARSWRSSASLGTPRACTLIAQRCRADVQRRRLGRTRTTGFRPLGERMAANRHGMRPRGRSAPPLGPHGESRTHILKILGRSPHGPLPRAVVGTSGVGGGLAAWFATRRGCDWPRRPRHRQWRRALRRALERSLANE